MEKIIIIQVLSLTFEGPGWQECEIWQDENNGHYLAIGLEYYPPIHSIKIGTMNVFVQRPGKNQPYKIYSDAITRR